MVFILDKINFFDWFYVDFLLLKCYFIYCIGIEVCFGYIFFISFFFRGENLNWKFIENFLLFYLKYLF